MVSYSETWTKPKVSTLVFTVEYKYPCQKEALRTQVPAQVLIFWTENKQ
jgi:hypothetical protein